jgi:hypothetical protein
MPFIKSFAGVMGFALVLALGTMLIIWVIGDAMNRGRSPLLVVIAVVFFFPFGLLAWLVLRPRIVLPPERLLR